MSPFTVVIATHERPALLRRAIASVLDQAEGLAQLVVVSDSKCVETFETATSLLGSDDRFVQRVGSPGPAESRNIGMCLAEGRFVIFLDDDDALSANYLETALANTKQDKVIYTDFISVVEHRDGDFSTILRGERRSLEKSDVGTFYIKNFIPNSCLVFPREAVAGRRFDTQLDYEDWDFLLGVAADFAFEHVAIDGPILYSRDVEDNRGRGNDRRLEQTYRQIYKKWPAPSLHLKTGRQDLLKSNGLAAALDDL